LFLIFSRGHCRPQVYPIQFQRHTQPQQYSGAAMVTREQQNYLQAIESELRVIESELRRIHQFVEGSDMQDDQKGKALQLLKNLDQEHTSFAWGGAPFEADSVISKEIELLEILLPQVLEDRSIVHAFLKRINTELEVIVWSLPYFGMPADIEI